VKCPDTFRDAKVVVVSPVAGGSFSVSRHVVDAFDELGADVTDLDMSWLVPPDTWYSANRNPSVRAQLVDYASELVLAETERVKPDLCFVMAQAPLSTKAVEALRAAGVRTAYWFVENYRLTRYWSTIAPSYDWFFTAQRGRFQELLTQTGCANTHWLPLACNPKRHRPRRLTERQRRFYGSDVSFAGFGYYNRRELFRGLSDMDFKIWGSGWESSAVARLVQRDGRAFDHEDFVRIASAAQIHVNLHSAAHVPGVDPDGDYLNPRVFELAACEAFQLCDPRSDLSSMFHVPREIPVYDDIASLRNHILHYSKNPEERRCIARAARARALADHTYVHRMLEVARLTLTRERSLEVPAYSGHLEGFPAISVRRFRDPEDFTALVDELALEDRASDDEVLLRLASVSRRTSP